MCLLQVVDDGHWFFGFLLGAKFLVLLDNDISLFDLFLVSVDLVRGELNLAHALEEGPDSFSGQAIFGETEVFKSPVGLEDVYELGDGLAVEVVV